MLRWIKRHRRSSTAAGLVTAVSIALGVVAFSHDGFTTTDVEMHDGSVWVTKSDTLQLGHLNVQAGELDAALTSPSNSFDVLQDAGRVLLLAHDTSTAMVVDPATVQAGTAITLPPGGAIAMGGGMVAVTDPETGMLWPMRWADLPAFAPATTEPAIEVGGGVVAAVGRDGTIVAVSPETGVEMTVREGDDGLEPQSRERGELRGMDEPTITMVGDRPVVLDAASQTLLLPGGAVQTEADAVLQQVGDAADRVLLASPTSLVRQPLDGGGASIDEVADTGSDAVAPVQLGGCAFGIWPATGRFVRDCADDGRDTEELVEQAAGTPLVFRVNRDTVVLNQFAAGRSWLLSDELIMVDNWDDLVPPQSEETSDEESESTEDVFENVTPPVTEENSPPTANDDDFGARAGRSTLLPVLWNDSDPDGDVLTASLSGDVPEGVSVAAVENDSQLQVQLSPSYAGGDFAFEYAVADGRGESDTATVRLAVRGDDENSVPEPLRETTFVVEQGATAEYQVLQDWHDPDGDDMVLVDAVSDSGDTIQTDASGRLVYTATGEAGLQAVLLTISDGRDSTTGELQVDVREPGSAPPFANADFVSTVAGREVAVRPLLNDYSPSGAPLRLAQVGEVPGVTMQWDPTTGTVRIVDGPVGTHYFSYIVAADGPETASGRIRVDIREPDDEARPVAVRDTALLPQQGEALVDLLANDVDPTGGVLVVQQLTIENGAPISVELIDRRLARIRDARGIDAPFQFSYTVSNGRFSETGTVEVIPVAPPAQPRAPVAVDDSATVRAGDFQTVDVLGNDFSPDGGAFALSPQLVDGGFASLDEGLAFVSEGRLRVHALEAASGRVTIAYEIVDELGNRDSATLTVEVVPRADAGNDPPMPRTVTSRVLAGSSVRIPIPLEGIDPDGDGVDLVGYDSAPDQGEITETGADHFVFEAYPDAAGTVEFVYRVRDRWGEEATASAIIGIAPAASVNQTPFAELDTVVARPDRSIAIPVLDNDSDPDQDPLSLQPEKLELPPELEGAAIDRERGTIDLRTPAVPGIHQFTYGVEDSGGASTTGTVMLTVDADAQLLPPIAKDDPVPAADVVLGQPMRVPVLANDVDPDGDADELQLSIVTGRGTVVGDEVEVEPTDAFQVITYRVTDVDGQTAEAFLSVPAVRSPAPMLASTEPVQVPSGVLRELPLREFVVVSSGNAPRITSGETVTAVNADGSALVIDPETLAYTSVAGYTGPASITFEVTDGTSPEDPAGNTAVLTIPIEVIASSVIPPIFAGASLEVVAGERATEFDLRAATTDPDPGDLEAMRYDGLAGSGEGVLASLNGSVFTASAERTTRPGTTTSYQVRITDPHGNEITGTVLLTVVATDRPLAATEIDAVEGVQGQPLVIDVLRNDFNPYANDGVPLRVVDAQVAAGDGVASFGDREATVTPGPDFSGLLTVQYTVEDATELTERRVTGTVAVTVKGRPDAPLRPNVKSVGDRQVTLEWAAPLSNGAPITGYLVQSADGSASQQCPSTTCAIEGLQNNVTYTFHVTAQNEVGDSDASPASADARPDVRPEAPPAPTATRGDTQLDIAWAPAVSNGSPVTNYILEISPAPASGTIMVETGTATSYTWTGLANGTAYSFRVRAENLAPEPGDWSTSSRAETPAGRPFPVTGVTSSVDRSIPREVQMSVSWAAANGNGAEVTTYTVTPSRGQAQTVTGTSASFASIPADGSEITFTVVATNAVGASDASAPTPALRAVNGPEAPGSVSVVDGDGQVQVSFAPGATNGLRADEVLFEVSSAAGVQQMGPGGTYTGLSNHGGPYAVQVRAFAIIDGQRYESAWAASSNQASPYGPPPAPTIWMTSQTEQVTYFWQPNGTNGRPLARIEWTQENAGADIKSVDPTAGSQSQSLPGGHQAFMTAIVVDVDGNVSERVTVGPVVAGYQPGVISLQRGPVAHRDTCNVGKPTPCYAYELHWSNMVPGTYDYNCFHTVGLGQPATRRVVIPAASGSTRVEIDDSWLCHSGEAGEAWMTVTGGPSSQDIITPRIAWPGP
ncbi:Ig-like domain-containing protein [Agrococcus beijingensis]|uniref:Ig-like domain-containing protein n=1 Tax=Agrococcus beijingensis TaxID=3068634 RepID=UPI0027417945|nr:Ig-like domain-containing protein [Agrococcus sp. REN33]